MRMFYDVNRVTYEKLRKIVSEQKPYANTTNVYPLGAREYSNRHFRLREDGSMDCFYSNRTTRDEVETGVRVEKPWDTKFATIYPDNTIVLNKSTNAQSENLILQNMLHMHVFHEKARGGTVMREGMDIMHPVFDGLRLNLATHESIEPYVVNVRKLDKKLGKEFLKPYEEFKKIASILIDPMSDEGIHETLSDLKMEYENQTNLLKFITFKNLIDQNRYVDAGVWLANKLNLNYLNWSSSTLGDRFKSLLRQAIATKTDKFLLSSTDIPFKLQPIEGGKYFPTSTWGYVIVQNNEVKQRF